MINVQIIGPDRCRDMGGCCVLVVPFVQFDMQMQIRNNSFVHEGSGKEASDIEAITCSFLSGGMSLRRLRKK